MRLFIDTHSFLWFIMGNEQLSHKARNLIADPDNTVLISVGSGGRKPGMICRRPND